MYVKIRRYAWADTLGSSPRLWGKRKPCRNRLDIHRFIPRLWGKLQGKQLSFVYDVADLCKTLLTVLLALATAAEAHKQLVPPGLRGELSRWLVEVSAGTFMGCVSGLVREQLWELCEGRADGSTAQMIWKAATPQGFDVQTHNLKGRYAERVDGVWLVAYINIYFI